MGGVVRCAFSERVVRLRELLAMAKKTARRYAFRAPMKRVKIVPAKLGEDAGIIGAAALVDG